MSLKKTSIILCTYNEGKYIEESIKKLKNHIKNLELIIVDDDSKDETRNIIEKINSNNEIKLIHRTKTKGLASAFLTGLIQSSGEHIGWIDTNMSELAEKFPEMGNLLETNFDIVILSRYIDGGGDKRNKLRAVSSKYFNYLCSFLLGSKIKDYTSGIFLMKRKVLNEVNFLAYGHGEFFIEFVENANRKGFNIKEIPYVQMKDDELEVSKTAGNLINFIYLGFIYFLRILKTIIRRN